MIIYHAKSAKTHKILLLTKLISFTVQTTLFILEIFIKIIIKEINHKMIGCCKKTWKLGQHMNF